jgi:hypothetical protein
MKITLVQTDCRDKVSPNCTKTFMRKVQRGRPQVNCDACKAFKAAVPSKSLSDVVQAELGKGQCPCGTVFDINPGRGRKPSKCQDCRTAGTVYRRNAETGDIDEIRKEALAEEQREIREQNGRDRAARLVDMMAPLIARDAKRRSLIAA